MEHALTSQAVEIARPFGFPITNSMLVTWIVAACVLAFAQTATRQMRRVSSGAQNLLEWLVERPYRFLDGLLGRHLLDRTFWYFASAFIFILTANWFGLIPGVGSIGWGHEAGGHFVIDRPPLRGANAGVNLTLAIALVFFACRNVWGVRENGVGGMFAELFAPNTLGEPLDGKGPIATDVAYPVEKIASGIMRQRPISQPCRPASWRSTR